MLIRCRDTSGCRGRHCIPHNMEWMEPGRWLALVLVHLGVRPLLVTLGQEIIVRSTLITLTTA